MADFLIGLKRGGQDKDEAKDGKEADDGASEATKIGRLGGNQQVLGHLRGDIHRAHLGNNLGLKQRRVDGGNGEPPLVLLRHDSGCDGFQKTFSRNMVRFMREKILNDKGYLLGELMGEVQ